MGERKTYILDTNVLIHDPESIFNFQEHEVVVPFEALEELDSLKKRNDQRGHYARQVIRYLGDLIGTDNIDNGLPMKNGGTLRIDTSSLRKNGEKIKGRDMQRPISGIDNRIIELASSYKRRYNGNTVYVSKDINSRIKAKALGINVEDYKTDKIDPSAIYPGYVAVSVEASLIDEFHVTGEISAEIIASPVVLLENQCLLMTYGQSGSILAVHKNGRLKKIGHSGVSFWGMKPKNKEQQFALHHLGDNAIPAVTLVGQAGTGKTMLALAVGLHKVLEEGTYQKIFITKPVIPVGRQEIGFLPGDKDDKMLPWVQSVFDNFSALSVRGQKVTLDYLKMAHLLEIESIAYIRGRSIAKSWIIVDEAQNLTPHEIKTVLSRVGEGSKIVLTGDIHQIDSPYLDAGSNGLSYLVDRFKGQSLYGHITLNKTIRSPLSSLAAELL